jgi:hypothetical protein
MNHTAVKRTAKHPARFAEIVNGTEVVPQTE